MGLLRTGRPKPPPVPGPRERTSSPRKKTPRSLAEAAKVRQSQSPAPPGGRRARSPAGAGVPGIWAGPSTPPPPARPGSRPGSSLATRQRGPRRYSSGRPCLLASRRRAAAHGGWNGGRRGRGGITACYRPPGPRPGPILLSGIALSWPRSRESPAGRRGPTLRWPSWGRLLGARSPSNPAMPDPAPIPFLFARENSNRRRMGPARRGGAAVFQRR